MPSTYTTNLGIEQPATGEQGGVWGVTANNSYAFLDTAIDGNVTIPLSASSFNLNTLPGAASQGRNKIIIFTGALTGNATVNITPNTAQKIYFFTNATTGGFSIQFVQGSGSFTLQPNCSAMVYCDGLGSGASVNGANYNPQFGSVSITGQLTVSGGLSFTGAASFAQSTFSGPTTLNGTTTVANLVIGAGSPYDIYYRAPGTTGIATALAVGAPGQVLGVNGSGQLAWANVGVAVGSAIPGAGAFGVFFASAAGLLAQDANFTWNGTGLGIGQQAAHPLHIGGPSINPQAWLDTAAVAAQTRQLVWATAGLARWALSSPPAAENPPTNVSSNLGFASFADNGSQLGWTIMMFRATGHVSIGTSNDGGCQLFVQNAAAGQPAMIVRGAASQSQPLQVWQNSAGTTLASIDQNGVLTSAGGGSGSLSLNAQGRLDLHGSITGHPYGTIHIGPEAGWPPVMNCSLAMEGAQEGPDALPNGVIRMYYRSSPTQTFVIQFNYGGTQYFASLPLVQNPGSVVNWTISPVAI